MATTCIMYDALVDGVILKELDEKILEDVFGFEWFVALKLMKFARHGYLSTTTEEKSVRIQSLSYST